MLNNFLLMILFFQAPQPSGAIEQELRRQQQELRLMRAEILREFEQAKELQNERIRLERELHQPICTSDLRWVGNGQDRKVSGTSSATVPLSLLSTVSRAPGCLSAEIRITASYLDAADNLICNGSIEGVATQSAVVQSINLLLKPWSLPEFVRWRNEPPSSNSGAKRLVCLNPEGTAEATDTELERVSQVRISATLLPALGGVSTVETRITLP